MTSWAEVSTLLTDMGDPRSPARTGNLYTALVDQPPQEDLPGDMTASIIHSLTQIDRPWLATLGEDPDRSRADIDRAVAACEKLRTDNGHSALPLRYARVELCPTLGQRADAIEQLRVARLFSFGEVDASATLAAAKMHDDFSGVIRTTTAVVTRPDADPAGTARNLAASLLPYLAQNRKVEAEDAMMSLGLIEIPDFMRIRVLGDQMEYLGLSGQWERAFAILRHTDLTDASSSSAWSLMNGAAGTAVVLRESVRAGYGANALGSTISWTTPWGPALQVTGWDTVAHAYDAVTAFARSLAVRFDRRNDNNGVSLRIETRMASEIASLATRSYGTVTGGAAIPSARLLNRGALLEEVNDLLVLARGYGLDSVRERAISTAETVSQSLAELTDDSQLEIIVDLRIAFSRLLTALGAHERAEAEALDTTELCLSQGWLELGCASMVIAAQSAASRGDHAGATVHWQRIHELLTDWGTIRMGERLGAVINAIGDPCGSVRLLTDLAEITAEGVETTPARASGAREVCRRARAELERCRSVPDDVSQRLAAVEQTIAPYGRGRSGRRRAGGERTAATPDRASRPEKRE
ncbi:hypothetical protein [Actinomyces oricola]